MSVLIRLANRSDAPLWIDLLRVTLGNDYPAREVYDLEWVARELSAGDERQTWVAEEKGRFLASISFLEPIIATRNPVANLGRCLIRPDSLMNGAAQQLLNKLEEVVAERKQLAIMRVPLSDKALQALCMQHDFVCAGFQPAKHLQPTREGMLFYVQGERRTLAARWPISHSLAQVGELGSKVLGRMGLSLPLRIEDGATGYPLQSLVEITESNNEQFEAHARDSAARQVPAEISTGYHRGSGLLRVKTTVAKALLAQRDAATTAGLLWIYDEHDHCVRIVDAFSTDDLSLGPLLFRTVAHAQQTLAATYVEMDVLMNAPRLLKTAEQLGFVPMAYFPALHEEQGHHIDVVKMVKLNVPHTPEGPSLDAATAAIVKSIEGYIEDQRAGVAVINLLRGLAMFHGLGDGELRKIASLFQQRLVRPGETIFVQGGTGDEAFIVLRGKVEIMFDDPPRPVAVIEPGQIFGEQGFLDGSPRTATAAVSAPAIVLVMHRNAFHELSQRQPHLGLVVMRNIAGELSAKLRKTNSSWVAERKD
jgi:hypothetical protein